MLLHLIKLGTKAQNKIQLRPPRGAEGFFTKKPFLLLHLLILHFCYKVNFAARQSRFWCNLPPFFTQITSCLESLICISSELAVCSLIAKCCWISKASKFAWMSFNLSSSVGLPELPHLKCSLSSKASAESINISLTFQARFSFFVKTSSSGSWEIYWREFIFSVSARCWSA